jgi:hypothetical protein
VLRLTPRQVDQALELHRANAAHVSALTFLRGAVQSITQMSATRGQLDQLHEGMAGPPPQKPRLGRSARAETPVDTLLRSLILLSFLVPRKDSAEEVRGGTQSRDGSRSWLPPALTF